MTLTLDYTLQITAKTHSNDIEASLYHSHDVIKKNKFTYNKLDQTKLFEIFLSWLTELLEPVLYHEEFDNIALNMTITSAEAEKTYGAALAHLNQIIKNTQNLIRKYKPLFQNRENCDHLLFYNVDQFTLFEEVFLETSKIQHGKTHYLNCRSGWDKKNRAWENNAEKDSLKLEDLIHYILENKIQHIYTVNMYYLFQLMEEQFFFVLPLFKALKVEWITIDYDLYASSNAVTFIQRNAFHCHSFRHMSLWPHVIKPLDEAHKNKNILYYVPNKIIEETASLEALKSNYDVVVISHMRIEMVLFQLPEILFFLEQTDPENPYLDFQKIFYSLLHVLISDNTLSLIEKDAETSHLISLYFDILSFLKYDVIQTLLDNHIPTKLYGDHSWEVLFPSIYQKTYLSEEEICALLQSREHLYLLMNQNYSYFESNLVVSRALQQKAPYLCFESAVITEELSGLKKLEYKNKRELIQKIPTINDLIRDKNYQESLKEFCIQNNACRYEFIQTISHQNTEKKCTFEKIYKNHQSLFLKTLNPYFKENHERIFYLYDEIFSSHAKNFNIASSRYSKEPFFQKLARHYKQQ